MGGYGVRYCWISGIGIDSRDIGDPSCGLLFVMEHLNESLGSQPLRRSISFYHER